MASSRLQRIGTIFSRVTGLLKSGAMKSEDKPLWYDVYKSFPPKYEPTFARKVAAKPIRPLLYEEDLDRAALHKNSSNLGIFSLKEFVPPKDYDAAVKERASKAISPEQNS